MSDADRELGATFAPSDILWLDFETVSREQISTGTDRYARSADAVMLAWAVGDDPVGVEAVTDFPGRLCFELLPDKLKAAIDDVLEYRKVICAHNAGFDRAVWQHSTDGFPPVEADMVICTRVQATLSGLPANLDAAARYVGADVTKASTGRALIKLFCEPKSVATPKTHPEEWLEFGRYAQRDVGAMRSLFKLTRQLTRAEWDEYWVAERINDRGVGIDLPFVSAAAAMAAEDQKLIGHELARLTHGAVTTVNQTGRIIEWLKALLPDDGYTMLVKREEVVDPDTKEITKPQKDSLERDRVVRLIAYLHSLEPLPEPLRVALRVLEIRRYGGSKTPAKFARMLTQHVDGVLRGQYVFNGASQTGRFSAKGVQVHNLARDPLPYEIDAIDALVADINHADFVRLGSNEPVSRKLSLLIRPALVPDSGKIFAWGDWSNIEARLVPWLANDADADKRLDIFRAVDDGTEKYDIYTRTAAQLSGLSLDQSKEQKVRQQGKIVELACGFGGGKNALLSMAASYGVHLEEDVAKAFVDTWRRDNPWAVEFWGAYDGTEGGSYGLWGALNKALQYPGVYFEAGLVGYIFDENYLGGSLLCQLPSGRWLTYRRCKWENVEVLNDDDEVVDHRRELMFSREHGRVKLWPGLACENIVQATAADILRGTLLRLDADMYSSMPVRLHTHDEVLVETDEMVVHEAAHLLRNVMEFGFDWSAGLPIAAETVIGRWYSKSKGSIGL